MAFAIDLSGLVLLENEIAALQAQQAAAPTTFTGGQPFSFSQKGITTPGTQTTMTTAQLVQRIQALLLAAQSLPQ